MTTTHELANRFPLPVDIPPDDLARCLVCLEPRASFVAGRCPFAVAAARDNRATLEAWRARYRWPAPTA